MQIAEYGQEILGDHLIGLQAGNEPDLYERYILIVPLCIFPIDLMPAAMNVGHHPGGSPTTSVSSGYSYKKSITTQGSPERISFWVRALRLQTGSPKWFGTPVISKHTVTIFQSLPLKSTSACAHSVAVGLFKSYPATPTTIVLRRSMLLTLALRRFLKTNSPSIFHIILQLNDASNTYHLLP